MPAATITIGPGIAEGELSPTAAQLLALNTSCLQAQINLLSSDQKSQLKSNLSDLRNDIVSASDLLRKRRGRIQSQITTLNNELKALGSGQNTMNDFYRLMGNAIASCPEAEQAATQIKTSSDRVLQQAEELNYQIAIANIQLGNLNGQIDDTQSALGVVDQINLAIG